MWYAPFPLRRGVWRLDKYHYQGAATVLNSYYVSCLDGVWECSPVFCPAALHGRRYNCKHIDYVRGPLLTPTEGLAEAAQKYLELGWSVIPLQPKNKSPLIKWHEFQRTRATPALVAKWWVENPDANVGVVTGAVSGLVVIDVDSVDGPKFESNLIHATGRGLHYFFLAPPGITTKSRKISKNIDLKAEGGYVVMPPSIHPSGRRYSVLKNGWPTVYSYQEYGCTGGIHEEEIRVYRRASWRSRSRG